MIISEKKKKILFLSVSAFAILLCGTVAFFKTERLPSQEKQVQAYEVEQYIVSVYEEKIAVFTQGDSLPIEIYDVYIGTLPEKDQKSLRKGIAVQGKARLRQMIEDYTS